MLCRFSDKVIGWQRTCGKVDVGQDWSKTRFLLAGVQMFIDHLR